MLAIFACESGFDTNARNTTGNSAGVDRGIAQFNDFYHHEVSDDCAYLPECAIQEAYRVSSGGTNFTPWATYNNGCYLKYLSGYNPTNVPGVSNVPTTSTTNLTTSNVSTGTPLDILSGLGAWISNPLRLVKMAVGIILIGLSLVLLMIPDAQKVLQESI